MRTVEISLLPERTQQVSVTDEQKRPIRLQHSARRWSMLIEQPLANLS
jgi:hypothetical protein